MTGTLTLVWRKRDDSAFTAEHGPLLLVAHRADGMRWGYTIWQDDVCVGGRVASAWSVWTARAEAEADAFARPVMPVSVDDPFALTDAA